MADSLHRNSSGLILRLWIWLQFAGKLLKVPSLNQTTNLGVRGSNPFGRAKNSFENRVEVRRSAPSTGAVCRQFATPVRDSVLADGALIAAQGDSL